VARSQAKHDEQSGVHLVEHPLQKPIEQAYEAAFGRTIRKDTLAALRDIAAWLDEHRTTKGYVVRTTWFEAARAVGWESDGRRRDVVRRHHQNLKRRLDMLVVMGAIEEWHPVYDDLGTGEGILVRLWRGSSVGRAHD
jgi:hypothetical protein